ncbi:hypothetical protein GCM10007972_12730 [Iodidimonas muriae]|uniref:Tetratricopeptide repeat protein n=1 Tax=Iodidimonas muriae TaxID=261467 RepID=A0ABQ2LCG8_9PROT|nr:hypothetical protein [Iodidimonas muriae]GGO10232.1 hypothetical protein GCM10007972_12730 [Iodidimonas muriae]
MHRPFAATLCAALAGVVIFSAPPFMPLDDQPVDLRAQRLADYLDPSKTARLACKGSRKNALAALFQAGTAHAADSGPTDGGASPILFEGLGDHSVPISTDHAGAQALFDQGLKFAYAFNHEQAARSFRAAQMLDPTCAMCFWGEALVLGPNINAPMGEDARVPALKALAMAKANIGNALPLEKALIEALDHRYSTDLSTERADADMAYATAMQDLADRYPQSDLAQTLTAEAIMDSQPWTYWEPDGQTPMGKAGDAITRIETVLARTPNHAGAIHLYIHLVEASAKPEIAEPYADRLAALMPSAGHIAHMPSHLYYRLGKYKQSLSTNIKAIAADEAYFDQVGREGIYGYGYYPHNVHFLLVSAQMAGDAITALEAAKKLESLIPVEAALAAPAFMQPIMAAPLYAHVQFLSPDKLRTIPKPDARMPFVLAIWHYSQGMAAALDGDENSTKAAVSALRQTARSDQMAPLTDNNVPADKILGIAAHILEGRLALTQKKSMAAAAHFKAAAELQDSLPYMEPPFWYYPARQSLGAALMAAGKADEAVVALNQSLLSAPNNAYALFMLRKAETARGNEAAAKAAQKAYEAAWAGKGAPPEDRI